MSDFTTRRYRDEGRRASKSHSRSRSRSRDRDRRGYRDHDNARNDRFGQGRSGYNDRRGRHDRNGGGGGGYGGGRRDRFDNHDRRGGRDFGGRGGGQVRQAKPPGNMQILKHEDELPDRVNMARILLTRMADLTSDEFNRDELPATAQAIAGLIAQGGDLEGYTQQMTTLFVKCATKLGIQAAVISSMLACIFPTNAEFVRGVIGGIEDTVNASIRSGDIPAAKLGLRSLSVLARHSVVAISGPNGFGDVLSTLLDVTTNTAAHVTDAMKDTAAYLVASTLIWSADALVHEWSDGLRRAQEILSAHATGHHSVYDIDGRCAVFHADVNGQGKTSGACSDNVLGACSVACAAIQAALDGEFVLPTCALYVWSSMSLSTVENPVTLDVLSVNVTREIEEGNSDFADWLHPILSIYDDSMNQAAKACCELDDSFKHFLRDYIEDVIHFLAPVVRPDGTRIGSADTVAKHLLGLKKLLDPSHVAGVHAFVVMEVVFGMMTQLPKWNTPYLFRIIVELCLEEERIAKQRTSEETEKFCPGAVAYACEVLFQLSPALDTFASRSLCDWLALHLSNTKFTWPFWEHWATESQQVAAGDAPEQFLRLLIQKCALLAPASRLTPHIPEPLRRYLPSAPVAVSMYLDASGSVQGSEDVDEDLKSFAKLLLQKIQDREDPEDLAEWLTGEHTCIDSLPNGEARRAHILVHVLLSAGAHTVTHTIATIDRYRLLLQELAPGEGAERAMINAVTEVWTNSPWHVNFVLDACMRRLILLPRPVSAWVLEDQNLNDLPHDAWKIEWICTAVERTLHHIKAAIQSEKDKQQTRGASAHEATADQTLGVQEEEDIVEMSVAEAKILAQSLFMKLGAKMSEKALQHASGDASGWQGHRESSMDPHYLCWLSLCKWTVRAYRATEQAVHKLKGEFVPLLDSALINSEMESAGIIEPVRALLN